MIKDQIGKINRNTNRPGIVTKAVDKNLWKGVMIATGEITKAGARSAETANRLTGRLIRNLENIVLAVDDRNTRKDTTIYTKVQPRADINLKAHTTPKTNVNTARTSTTKGSSSGQAGRHTGAPQFASLAPAKKPDGYYFKAGKMDQETQKVHSEVAIVNTEVEVIDKVSMLKFYVGEKQAPGIREIATEYVEIAHVKGPNDLEHEKNNSMAAESNLEAMEVGAGTTEDKIEGEEGANNATGAKRTKSNIGEGKCTDMKESPETV